MKSNKFSLSAVLLGALAFTASACSSIKAEPDKVKEVKKVAIIGYSVQQPVPPTLFQSIVDAHTGADKNDGGMMGGMHAAGYAKESPHASKIYDRLADVLVKRFHWSPMALADVTNNPDYAALFKENTEGFHARPMAGKNDVTYGVPGLLDGWMGYRLDGDQKRKLMAELGVDALVVASIKVELKSGGGLKALVGSADLVPQSTLEFRVYDKNSNDPIWLDMWAHGEPNAQGASHVMGVTDYDMLNERVVESTQSAFAQLVKRIQDQGVTFE